MQRKKSSHARSRLRRLMFEDPTRKKEGRKASKEGVQVEADGDDEEDSLEFNFREHGRRGAITASEKTMDAEDLEPNLEIDGKLTPEHRENLRRLASDAP